MHLEKDAILVSSVGRLDLNCCDILPSLTGQGETRQCLVPPAVMDWAGPGMLPLALATQLGELWSVV